MSDDKKPTPEAIKMQLERILKSAEFRATDKQRKFLSFVVDESLEDRASQLKGYTIAVDVYERTEKFDPQADPIVRLEAGRLRRALENYYLKAGKNDPIRIEIPKGRYVPTFHIAQTGRAEAELPGLEGKDGNQLSGPSIAVMPLLNLTNDNEQDFFADGLTEEITNELARYQDLQVIGAYSAMQFRGGKADPRGIGKKLGVRFLLSGSFRRDSKTIKVSIQLIDTSTGVQIWGGNYKNDLNTAELIVLQETMAHRVVGAIADQFGSITRKLAKDTLKKTPQEIKSYDAILRFYHYERNLTPDVFKEALEALECAVEREPEYGLAWAMLAHIYADNYALEFCNIEDSLGKALMFAQKGVSLEPESQFAQDALTLVHFHRGDKTSFLKHVEKTIALNPNAPYIVGVAGWHLMFFGKWKRGRTLLEKGIELNPYYPSWFHMAPYTYHYHQGAYEKAFAEALKINYPELFWDPAMRAAALGQMGRTGEARTAIDELLRLVPDFATCGRRLIGRYVKKDDLVDTFIEGLRKAGLGDLE